MSNNFMNARPIPPEAQALAVLPNEIKNVVGTVRTLLTRPSGATILYLSVEEDKFLVKPGNYFIHSALATGINTTLDTWTTIIGAALPDGAGPYKMVAGTTLAEPFLSDPDLLVWVRLLSGTTYELYESYNQAIDLSSTVGRVDFTTQGVGLQTLALAMPAPAATSTDGYSSIEIERGATKSHGLDSTSVTRISAPSQVTVEGVVVLGTPRLAYWWA